MLHVKKSLDKYVSCTEIDECTGEFKEARNIYIIFLKHLARRDYIEEFRVDSRIGNLTEF